MELTFADQSDNILSAIQHLYKNQEYVDFHFISHDGCQKYAVHKLVLAIQSPILCKVVYGYPTCNEIKVENVEYVAVQNMINYFYNEDQIFADISSIRQTKQLADLYELFELGEICKAKFTEMQINVSNVLSVLEVAKELGNETKQAECLLIIGENQESVLTSQQFYNMQIECAFDVYEKLRERKMITEYIFLRSAIRWMKINNMLCKNLIMEKVDLHSMSLEEYLDIIEEQPEFFSSIEIAHTTKIIRHFSGAQNLMLMNENNFTYSAVITEESGNNEDYTDRNSDPNHQNVSTDEINRSSSMYKISNSALQENPNTETSSSHIEITDEIIEETILNSLVHPLSISSPVDVLITTPSSETGRDEKTKIHCIMCDVKSEPLSKRESTIEKLHLVPRSDPEYQRPRPSPYCKIINTTLQFQQSMSWFEWGVLAGVVIGIFFTFLFYQSNIFAVEKDDVVSQMKIMIDEKLLKDPMLSDMKTIINELVKNSSKHLEDQMLPEKCFSSFEHEIKEIKEENSRVNHILKHVAEVIEKQMDTLEKYEKKEAEHAALFKEKINQLNYGLNSLKIETEELGQQFKQIKLNLEAESWYIKFFSALKAIFTYFHAKVFLLSLKALVLEEK